jgi:hypothetical protein
MTEKPTLPKLELAHSLLDEAAALAFLAGHRISLGARTMDPKAQIVGEFVKSIRVPGYYPPLPELRQQLRTMVTLMDEAAPALARIEEITIPGPAGPIPARVYDASATEGPRPALAYFHGGGWVQGDLETHPRPLRAPGAAGRHRGGGGGLPPGPRAQVPRRGGGLPGRVWLAPKARARYRRGPGARGGGRRLGGGQSLRGDLAAGPCGGPAGADLPGAHLSGHRFFDGDVVASRARGRAHHSARPHSLVRGTVSEGRGRQDRRPRLAPFAATSAASRRPS